jgi:ABC-type phosphate transport system substrate-binding protein
MFEEMRFLSFVFALLSLSWQGGFAQQNTLDELVFVANVKGTESLTSKEVVQIFRNGRSLWPSGEKVIIVLPSNKSEFAESVARNLYGGSVTSMQKFWLALVFQGRANPPVFVQTADEVLAYIAKNPGSIGVFPKGEPMSTQRYLLMIR